jgi:5-bromo-4-chloroindolyl phosphate hydrolysis protein
MLTNGQYLLRHGLGFSLGIIGATIIGSVVPPLGIYLNFAAFAAAFPTVYFGTTKGLLRFQQNKRSKQLGISRNQFLHIEDQLQIASKQANALTQKYVQVRSVKAFRPIYDMSKLTKRIVNIVRQDPNKFFMIEEFFYAHLPSAVELSDKYALLTKEQVSGTDIHLALNDTRVILKDLYHTMETDLKIALTSDIESLKLELDYAKHANEQRQQQLKIGGDND